MIGHLNPDSKDVTVIGAGISGLLSAYRLLQAGYTVTVLEKSGRAGGLISTIQTEYGPVETAAHSIRSSPEILRLFEELKIPYVRAKTSKKYIFRNGRLKGNPFKIGELFATACFAYFKKSTGEALTLADWARSHLGPASIDNMFVPLSNGIYAASPEELDQQLAFPRFTVPKGQTLFERIIKGKKDKEKSFVMAPANGMQDMIDKLAAFIQSHPQGTINYNQTVTTLADTQNIIVATPAHAAGMLAGLPVLETLAYSPMVTATVFLKKEDLDTPDGIGTLMARGEDNHILGILFNSSTFDYRVKVETLVSLTVMLGGTQHPNITQRSDGDLQAIITSELRRILKFKGTWSFIHLTRWPHAIPVYSASLREMLGTLKMQSETTPGRLLAGNYAGEVSIRGMCQSSLALLRQ